MVLETNISSFFEALVTFLSFKHLVKDIWERSNRIVVDPRKHELWIEAILVWLSDSQEEGGRHRHRVTSSPQKSTSSFLFVSHLLVCHDSLDFKITWHHVFFSVSEKNFGWGSWRPSKSQLVKFKDFFFEINSFWGRNVYLDVSEYTCVDGARCFLIA